VLFAYRKTNRIRSQSHPVPELATRDGWIEAPFWIWREGESPRGRLFVRQSGKLTELSNGAGPIGTLRLHERADACCAVEDLAAMAGSGWRLRSRALTTTLFARLCLADVFIHGIGGARYDEMTDRIIERFFGIAAPEFLTVTATLRLPLSAFAAAPEDERRLQRNLRDIEFNAERHTNLDADPKLQELIREKRRLVAERASESENGESPGRIQRSARRQRHLRLKAIEARLAAAAAETRSKLERDFEQTRRELAANRLLTSREYSWCLFPESQVAGLVERVRGLC
jgi:hypothetical protein